jgi:hypothetical protein
MPPNLTYYKSNPLHNTTRKRRGNEKTNNTMHPTLKRNNRGRRNLFKKARIGIMNEKNYITPRSNNEVNRRNIKYHGNTYRKSLANTNYKNTYNTRRQKMTQEERNAEKKEEEEINAELKLKQISANEVKEYRKKILAELEPPNNN